MLLVAMLAETAAEVWRPSEEFYRATLRTARALLVELGDAKRLPKSQVGDVADRICAEFSQFRGRTASTCQLTDFDSSKCNPTEQVSHSSRPIARAASLQVVDALYDDSNGPLTWGEILLLLQRVAPFSVGLVWTHQVLVCRCCLVSKKLCRRSSHCSIA